MKHFRYLILTAAACLGFNGCASLPFSPVKELSATPSDRGLAWEDASMSTSDGITLHGWYLPADPVRSAEPGWGYTLIFFHGNAGNISHRLASLQIFNNLGLSVLIFDYRGFGKSGGSPSVNGTSIDALAAWNWLLEKKQLCPEQIILFGRSLGGAVAASLAEKTEPAGLIIESSFTTLYDVAKHMFPLLPVSWFLPQDYDSIARLKNKNIPMLVVHSKNDEIIPYTLGRKIFDAYTGPKNFLEINGNHNEGFYMSLQPYTLGLSGFLRTLPPAPLNEPDKFPAAANE